MGPVGQYDLCSCSFGYPNGSHVIKGCYDLTWANLQRGFLALLGGTKLAKDQYYFLFCILLTGWSASAGSLR